MSDRTVRNKVIGVPLTKHYKSSDPGEPLIVRGKFTSDNIDEVGDVITREATERAIPKYKQWGNIRYMHQPRPVGKVSAIGKGDGLDWNEVEIKVIDPQAAFEVENGLLSALSVGIAIALDDIEMTDNGGWIINDYSLAEISLVDHPANYDAKLDYNLMTDDFRMAAREMGMVSAIKKFGLPKTQTQDIEKSPECRQEGESVDDCVSRKIPEIMNDDPEMSQDQAIAIAHSMCEEPCSEKSKSIIKEDAMPDTQENILEEEVTEEVTQEEKDLEVEEPVAEAEEVIEEEDKDLEAEVEAEAEVDETAEVEADVEMSIDEEAEEEIEAEAIVEDEDEPAPEFVEAGAFADFANAIVTALEDIKKSLEVTAEVPQAEEQTVDEVDETDVSEVDELKGTIEALSEKVEALTTELAELKKPANRKSAVKPLEVEEEVVDSEEEVEVVEEPKSLREAAERFMKTR